MSELVSIDFGSVLPYIEDKILSYFGKDGATLEAAKLLTRNVRLAIRDAALVQIVGMDRPIPLPAIFQPRRLRSSVRNTDTTIGAVVRDAQNAIIFGLPGAGKTLLLLQAFSDLAGSPDYLPAFFGLRRQNAIVELKAIVEALADNRIKKRKRRSVVLLVDGYDEVSPSQRVESEEALRDFESLKIGVFCLTSRQHYRVGDVHGEYYEIAPFSQAEAEDFIVAFGAAYRRPIDARELISEMVARGFTDFMSHPLLLALVCILKTGPLPELPRTTIELLKSAVETLTERWDESKAISRHAMVPLTAPARLRCIARIAFEMRRFIEQTPLVERTAAEFLSDSGAAPEFAHKLLQELAQWYGMLVPIGDDGWTFTHRTLHDYLAARHWVSSGFFIPWAVSDWNARAAYAACLTDDATPALTTALMSSDDLTTLYTCLENSANFDVNVVAEKLVEHFQRFLGYFFTMSTDMLVAGTAKDFFGVASTELLTALIRRCVHLATGSASSVILIFCAIELLERGVSVPSDLARGARERLGWKRRIRIHRSGNAHEAELAALISDA